MTDHSTSFELNRKLWNERVRHHVGSKMYDLEGFLQGRNSLSAGELELLGDVRGQRILHLQCHFGQDTLSLARMGADVTGLDLADAAIGEARNLAARMGLHASFITANVLDFHPQLAGGFDIVFTSYGVLGWLPELGSWARNITRYLKPGGKLVLVEFHPAVWMFDNELLKVTWSYFNRQLIEEAEQGTYADASAAINLTSHSWNHAIADTITALLDAGLHILHLGEGDGSPHDCFPNTVQGTDGLYRIKHMEGLLPLTYSVVASRERA
ncbi:MAG: class I SAM-dependent methyltransferase [Flavobacteriales bacterium]|nr:class I SAM-dependent methyltransferase [Flavobacteriales bacterium]MBP9081189.1 class I SAM-dependent methyltransferase [Flavobacteriales bacterium]